VEGTAKYGYVIVLPELDAGRIRLGATVGMEVRANLISGLVAIKFGFEAGATMGLVPENHNLVIITVQIDVSASVTAAWVFKARVSFHAEYTTEFPSWQLRPYSRLLVSELARRRRSRWRNRKIAMTNATRLTLMTFPQHWDGATLELRVLVLPRGNPLEPLADGIAFADGNVKLSEELRQPRGSSRTWLTRCPP
jgi:hypothetical protein